MFIFRASNRGKILLPWVANLIANIKQLFVKLGFYFYLACLTCLTIFCVLGDLIGLIILLLLHYTFLHYNLPVEQRETSANIEKNHVVQQQTTENGAGTCFDLIFGIPRM